MKRLLNKLSVSTLTIALAVILVFGGAIGGTLAWLTAKTDPVKNVFTVGQIILSLTETNEAGQTVNSGEQTFLVTPGSNITKDAKVTVGVGSVESWIFVEVVESKDFASDRNITYTVADGWTVLSETLGANGEMTRVYYRAVAETATADASYSVFANDTIVVDGAFAPAQGAGEYSITLTAYGIQKANLATASDAWTALDAALNP